VASRGRFIANGRRGFRRKAQYGWTAADPTVINIGNGTSVAVICAGSDWARGGGTSQSATLVGIRGGIAYQPGAVSGIIRVGIMGYDEGETVDSMATINTLVEEDVLWTWAYSQQSTVATTLTTSWVDVNVRSKRKLTLDSSIQLVMSGSAAAMGFVVPMLRACVKFS